jgi:ABC-type branched-subunit amino acid transport system substrate-binding protein
MRNDYQFVFEDAYMESRAIVTAYRRLVSLEGCKGFISFGGPAAKILKPLVAQDKVYSIGITMDPKDADAKYSFIHMTHPLITARTLIAYIKSKGYQHPYLLTMRLPHTMALGVGVNEALKEAGITPVGEDFVMPDERDFRTIIAKAMLMKPDIFLMHINSPESDIFLKQMMESHPEMAVTSAQFFDDVNEKSLVEGRTYVTQSFISPAFAQKCSDNGVTPRNFISHGYDMADLLINAFEAAKDGKTPGDYLRNLKDYPGAVGKLTMQPDGMIDSKANLVTVKNGKNVLVEQGK